MLFLNGHQILFPGRHAHGDQYKATDIVIPGNGNVKIIYTPSAGSPQEFNIFDFKDGGGVIMGKYCFKNLLTIGQSFSIQSCTDPTMGFLNISDFRLVTQIDDVITKVMKINSSIHLQTCSQL